MNILLLIARPFVIVLVLSLFSSCSKQPKADFTLNKDNFSIGDLVTCTNNSTNAKSVKWTLPDGTTTGARNAQFPIIPGTDPGTYSIRLQVFYGRDKTDEITKTFIVNDSPGTLTVWASQTSTPLTVYIDNEYWGQISVFYNSDPGCEAQGCLTKMLSPGDHTIQTTNGTTFWSSTVSIGKNSCVTHKLN